MPTFMAKTMNRQDVWLCGHSSHQTLKADPNATPKQNLIWYRQILETSMTLMLGAP